MGNRLPEAVCSAIWHVGFSLAREDRAPKNWGWGTFGKGAQLTGTINQLLWTLAPKAPRKIWSIKIGPFFLPNIWRMMTFLNPLDTLIPKIPFSFFAVFWVWVTSEAWGSVSVGLWGSCQWSLLGGGESGRRALSTSPPANENPAFYCLFYFLIEVSSGDNNLVADGEGARFGRGEWNVCPVAHNCSLLPPWRALPC